MSRRRSDLEGLALPELHAVLCDVLERIERENPALLEAGKIVAMFAERRAEKLGGPNHITAFDVRTILEGWRDRGDPPGGPTRAEHLGFHEESLMRLCGLRSVDAQRVERVSAAVRRGELSPRPLGRCRCGHESDYTHPEIAERVAEVAALIQLRSVH